MTTLEDVTPAMVDAGVRVLLAGHQQRTPTQIVCDIYLQMKAVQGLPLAAPLTLKSPILRRFVETNLRCRPKTCGAWKAFDKQFRAIRSYAFFKHLLACATIKRLLVLGVYHGRDIAYIMSLGRALGRPLQVVGVDKFSDDFCEDWPKERQSLNWQQAGFGTSPSFEAAQAHMARLGYSDSVTLVKERDERFLPSCSERFDAIYIDTSHDYDTVARQIRQTVGLLTEDGLLCGDDYSDQGTWGVKRAISEFAPGHVVFSNWVWIAARDQIRASLQASAA